MAGERGGTGAAEVRYALNVFVWIGGGFCSQSHWWLLVLVSLALAIAGPVCAPLVRSLALDLTLALTPVLELILALALALT